MSTRYLTNAVAVLLGGLIVVLSMGLASVVAVQWSAFGIAIGVVAMAVLAQLDSRRGLAQRLMDAGSVSVAGTLIGVTVFFTGGTLIWLVFALGLTVAAVAFAGLTVHEIESWRRVHDLGDLHWLHPRAELEPVEADARSERAA